MERAEPFSPRLRQASIHVIGHIWEKEFEASASEAIRWLNHLTINADDRAEGDSWAYRLVAVICSPTRSENLSSHYWGLLEKVVVASETSLASRLVPHGGNEVT